MFKVFYNINYIFIIYLPKQNVVWEITEYSELKGAHMDYQVQLSSEWVI